MKQLLTELFISGCLTHTYYIFARKYKVYDLPSARSSHTNPTIRGAGVVFSLSICLSMSYYQQDWFCTAGLLCLIFCSFWDDLQSVSPWLRLGVQGFAIGLLSFSSPVLLWQNGLLCALVGVFLINTFNFMDGINGMMGSYSLLTLVSCWYVNTYCKQVLNPGFFHPIIITLLVFLGYNFRTKALCFAGDVGSISMGYLIVFVLWKFIVTLNYTLMYFVSLFVLDTAFTLLQRCLAKQPLWQAHRLHLYQQLFDQYNLSPLVISGGYVALQLLINMVVIAGLSLGVWSQYCLVAGITILLCTTYFIIKKRPVTTPVRP